MANPAFSGFRKKSFRGGGAAKAGLGARANPKARPRRMVRMGTRVMGPPIGRSSGNGQMDSLPRGTVAPAYAPGRERIRQKKSASAILPKTDGTGR
jgi:hypothetical protein